MVGGPWSWPKRGPTAPMMAHRPLSVLSLALSFVIGAIRRSSRGRMSSIVLMSIRVDPRRRKHQSRCLPRAYFRRRCRTSLRPSSIIADGRCGRRRRPRHYPSPSSANRRKNRPRRTRWISLKCVALTPSRFFSPRLADELPPATSYSHLWLIPLLSHSPAATAMFFPFRPVVCKKTAVISFVSAGRVSLSPWPRPTGRPSLNSSHLPRQISRASITQILFQWVPTARAPWPTIPQAPCEFRRRLGVIPP